MQKFIILQRKEKKMSQETKNSKDFTEAIDLKVHT